MLKPAMVRIRAGALDLYAQTLGLTSDLELAEHTGIPLADLPDVRYGRRSVNQDIAVWMYVDLRQAGREVPYSLLFEELKEAA